MYHHHVHRTCACSRRQRPNCLPMMSFSGGIGQLVALFHGWTPFKELHVLGQPSTSLLTAVVTGYCSVRSAMYDQLLPAVKCLLAIPLQHTQSTRALYNNWAPVSYSNREQNEPQQPGHRRRAATLISPTGCVCQVFALIPRAAAAPRQTQTNLVRCEQIHV